MKTMNDSSENQRRFLKILSEKGRIKRNHALSKKYAQALLDLEIGKIQRDGRSDYIVIIRKENFNSYVSKRFPGGLEESPTTRLSGVMLRGNSKSGGNTEHAILIFRAFTKKVEEKLGFEATKFTSDLGLIGSAIHSTNGTPLRVSGNLAIVENLDVFMSIEHLVQNLDLAIYSGGILDTRIIEWLNSCLDISLITHAGDYDSTGLKEFIRYEKEIMHRTEFYLPDEITLEDFKTYGRSELVGKGNNLSKMEIIRNHVTDDDSFNKSLNYILKSGNGLEQEFLLSLIEKIPSHDIKLH